MTNPYLINAVASAIICLWATWCVLSPRVNDGIVGKLLLSCTALAALGCALAPTYGLHPVPEISLNVCLAGLGIRHFVIKSMGPAIRRRMKRLRPCDDCPNRWRQ